jgi:hypothetical protein
LTGSLERPGGSLREHDTFLLVLALVNTGTLPVANLAATLGFSAPGRVEILAMPVIGATQLIDGPGSARFTWTLRAATAGEETFTVLATGFSKGTALSATATRVDVVAPKPPDAMAYPNPVSGDTLRLALNLRDDADTVSADVYNASFRQVAAESWHDISRADGQVVIGQVSRWSPGVYAIRVKARLAGGGEQVFPPVKVRVKR